MHIITITDKNQLNKFITQQKYSQFLQSWEWGEFQKKMGNKIFRLGVEINGRLIAAMTLIKKKIFFNQSYLYCPRLDLRYKPNDLKIQNLWNVLFQKINSIAKMEKIIFLRFEPVVKLPINCQLQIKKTINVQPDKTLILNLSQSEQEMLKNMQQKTRYNIRLAEKRGVKIIEASVDKFEEFWNLMQETRQRDGFKLHDKEYYRNQLRITNYELQRKISRGGDSRCPFLNQLQIKLFLAEYHDKIIAANIVVFFGDTATYLHGASSNDYRNVMAPYLLQWHCIKLAKILKYKYYDFYGIDKEKWPGVTRFKKGFNGKEINYPGAYDLIFNNKYYYFYNVIRKIRRRINLTSI